MLLPRKEIESIPDYVPGKSIDEIREKYKLKSVIKLASNENPLGASPAAIAAYKKCEGKLHLYPRGSAPELVKRLSLKWKLGEENLIVGNGSDEILDLAARAYLQRGDHATGAGSTFSVYSSVTLFAGAKYKALPLDAFNYPLKFDKVGKAKIIFFCNPNNPTGMYYSNKVIFNFLKSVPQDTLVVLDMAYWEFTGEPEPPLSKWIKQFPNLLCTRTFSKLYGLAALRVGYGIASKQIISALKKIKPPFNTNYPAQMAATAALSDESFVEKTLKMNKVGRELLTQNLRKLNFEVLPSGANFVCVKVGKRAAELVAHLESRGIVVRHLKSFAMPEWIRVTVGQPGQNAQFCKELTKMLFLCRN